MSTNTRGTCFVAPSLRINAWILKSCVNGCLTTLNVPSRNHVRERARTLSWLAVANTIWRSWPTRTSARRKSSPMKAVSTSNSTDVGSAGRRFSRRRLVARFKFSTWRRLAGGASSVRGCVLRHNFVDYCRSGRENVLRCCVEDLDAVVIKFIVCANWKVQR